MSIFPKFFFTLFGNAPLPSWLRSYIARVEGDGGTVVDRNHTKEVYADTYPYEPTLIQPCNGGGSTPQNFAVGSEDISNATYWAVSGVTATSDAEPNPFGGSGVSLVAETGSTTAKGFYQQSVYQASIVERQAYTVSAYVKKGDGSLAPDIIQITYLSGGFGSDFYANYNISTGVVTKVDGGFAEIQDIGGGWYRISLAGVAVATGALGTFVLAFVNNDPNATRLPSYTGNTSRDVYVWGVQFVQGNEPGQYIKTTTAAIDSIGTLYSIIPSLSLLNRYSGAAAAYSLRSLSKSTTNVVKVRRDSDDSEQDFTASDITNGTLLSFVNQSVEKVLNGDFSDGSTDWTVVNGSITGGQYVSGTLTAYQSGLKQVPFSYTGTGVLTFDLVVNSGSVRVSAETPVNSYSTSGRKSVTLTNPTQLEFNAFNLGFDGTIDNVSFIPTNVDGFVTTWYDQSGNTNNATQATAANQPKIVSSGTLVTENGKAALDFDGTDDALIKSSFNITGTSAISSFSVGFGIETGANGLFSIQGVIGGADGYVQTTETAIRTGGGYAEFGLQSAISSSLVSTFFPSGGDISDILCFINGSSSSRIALVDATIDLGANTTFSFGLGVSSSYFDGIVQEVILYSSDQSANRTGIEANINDYYNIYP